MRIVCVSPVVPYPPRDGGAIRIFQLLKALSCRHEIHLLCLGDGPSARVHEAALSRFCSSVECFSRSGLYPPRFSPAWWRVRLAAAWDPSACYFWPPLQARLQDLLAAGAVDLVLIETLRMARYACSTPVRKTILCQQNHEPDLSSGMAAIEETSLGRTKYRLYATLAERAERRILRRFHYVTAVSERDAASFRRLAAGVEVAVVPNGVDLDRFFPSSLDDGQTVLITGSMGYFPNQDSVRFFCRLIWPWVRTEEPGARLVVAGSNAPACLPDLAGQSGVEVREPGEDITQEFARATVTAVPLRVGGGTRIKVLEALAAGKAVVSTSVGCEGLDVVPGRDLIVSDDPVEFARRVVELLRNPDRRKELGVNGRKLVEERYSWRDAGKQLEIFCEKVAEGMQRGPKQR